MAQTRSPLRQRKKSKDTSDDGKAEAANPRPEEKGEGGEDEIIIKNGKAYKKRKDLPDVGYLLTYGMPGKEGRSTRDPSKPWYTDFYLPGMLLLVFIASLVVFHHIPFKPREKPRYSLNDIRMRMAEQQRMEKVREEMRGREEQIEFAEPVAAAGGGN